MNSKHYILNVILSILTIFLILASLISTTVIATLGNSNSYKKVVERENICSYVQDEIVSSFEEYSHTSGLDTETFSAYYDESFIKTNVEKNIENYVNSILGKSGDYNYSTDIDFSSADASIDDFFSDYAEKTNYQKDETYESKLSEVKEKAHEIFIDKTDVYRFNLMNDNNIIQKISSKIPTVKLLIIACYIASAALIFVMIIVNRKENVLYWCGCPFLVSGMLTIIPALYLKASGFLNGFTIKEKPIFYSITGLLGKTLNYTIAFSLVSVLFGLIFVFLGIILVRKGRNYFDN